MPTIDDVLLALGRVQEGVERLTDDLQEKKTEDREHRATMHRRLDEQAETVGRLRRDVEIVGQMEGQLREEIKAVRKTIDANHASIQPDIEEWRRMRTLGRGFFFLVGLGGLSLGAFITYASDSAVAVIRHWLKIN